MPIKLNTKEPTPITQVLIPAANPGLFGRTWKAKTKLAEFYIKVTAIPIAKPKNIP